MLEIIESKVVFESVINGLCFLIGKDQFKSFRGNVPPGGRKSSPIDLVLYAKKKKKKILSLTEYIVEILRLPTS